MPDRMVRYTVDIVCTEYNEQINREISDVLVRWWTLENVFSVGASITVDPLGMESPDA